MAYGDYGGYAYRAGAFAPERSDALLTPDGVLSSPGAFPHFVHAGHRDRRPNHVLLGDGPVTLGLHKSSPVFYDGLDAVEVAGLVVDPLPGSVDHGYLDLAPYEERGVPAVAVLKGHRVELRQEDDGTFLHARLVQPDGTVWHGWSGYGVGAGHEDDGAEAGRMRDEAMRLLWEDAPRGDRE